MLFKEIWIEIALWVSPYNLRNLLNLQSLNKTYRTICNSNIFWYRYYHRYIKKDFSTHDIPDISNYHSHISYKTAFFDNYWELHHIDFSRLKPSDIWNIYNYDTSVPYQIPIENWNYFSIEKKDGIIRGIPILIPECFSIPKKRDIDIDLENYEESGIKRVRGKKRYTLENVDYVTVFDSNDIIMYPYHHNIIIDMNSEIYNDISPIINPLNEYDMDLRLVEKLVPANPWMYNATIKFGGCNKITIPHSFILKFLCLKIISYCV